MLLAYPAKYEDNEKSEWGVILLSARVQSAVKQVPDALVAVVDI